MSITLTINIKNTLAGLTPSQVAKKFRAKPLQLNGGPLQRRRLVLGDVLIMESISKENQ
jgi:hypothetical protein